MKKRNVFDKPDTEHMSDAELSKRLGRYQTIESIGMLPGILMVIAGCISAFIQHDVILLSILTFGGVGLILLVALPAQKKKKALLRQQLGGYFRDELCKAFGAEPKKTELPIDETFLRSANLLTVPWTECSVSDYHEGVHNGLRFSAANAELRRTVEERSGPNNDNWMTKTETLFHGIIVRCADICDPALDIAIRDQFQNRKKDDITAPDVFVKHFTVQTADGRSADSELSPQMRELVQKLEAIANNGKMGALVLQNGDLTLALNTRYVFAGVPEELDLRDIDGIRKWFSASLTGMERLLDLLTASSALSVAAE